MAPPMWCLSQSLVQEKVLPAGPSAAGASDREKRQEGYSTATIETRTGRVMGPSISPYQNPSVSAIGASPPEVLRRQMPTVDFSPAEIVRHRTAHWRGVQVETVQIISHEHFEYSFKQQRHLLIAVEQGVRYDGETLVEGLPASTVHNYSHKLILVPAGRRLFGTQNPRLLTRSICLYIDPQTVPVDPDLGFAEADLQPRLLFEDSSLWQTVLKLKAQIGSGDPSDHMYAEALGGLLAHELLRLHGATPASRPANRGGLAGWQQRRVIDFMEEHLAEAISLNVSRAIEPVSFPEIVQAVLRRTATPLLHGASHRTRKGPAGKPSCLDYGDRDRRRIRRDQCIQCYLSSDHGADAIRLSPQS